MKTIPHFVVTWARDTYSSTSQSELTRSPISHSYLAIPSPLSPSSPSFASGGRPLLLLGNKSDHDSTLRSPQLDRSPSLLKDLPADSLGRREETDDGWTLIRSQPQSQNITNVILSSFTTDSDVTSPALTDKPQRSPEWKDADFPPLDSKAKHVEIGNETAEDTYSAQYVLLSP